ncbi:nickel-dependent hydrogenase large subunit [Lacrimispora saccharolytica]|uniref:Nickel-dependent hydrogenase large subunit n=1 Tax=Lacrimispora saccharolytica (strain ATCC 35040 / DSM 2544 / NRCC 2533 / WM1) TaxID=610130 RepID=D9R2A3_LACSW|nr:nickel-dependent hydrogenase large subunit [Lacrimispora saccharolytica]ADL04753.1 nickel-dependent hydrogenase large subunit [[Clostridium] saccharolyticum WM1]QRV21027.1 nickel-dependent hydrogenase large subunit [Lacrimispora saccharolytica]
MAERVTINPITRINGYMEIDADIENQSIVDARTKGMMFRGFEKMLQGRSPFDAVYFTQRICGICSTAHSMASALALEEALNIVPSEQGRYLRDLLHACEFLQNHLRHFYQLTLPDYVKLPEDYPLFKREHDDFRLPKDINDKMVKDYFDSLEFSRNSHQMLAILGGKAPHNHGVFIGGITSPISADKIISIKSILYGIGQFITEKMIPDVYTIGTYYPEYYHMGGGYGNLLSYGCFNNYKDLGTLYVNPLVYSQGKTSSFDPGLLSQEDEYAWFNENDEPDRNKPQAYSWVKAPRYDNIPYEVGPLARQWLSGEYGNGISAMDRTIARVLEAKKIVEIMQTLIDNLIPGVPMQEEYEIPLQSSGKGLVDTTRGALGHWLYIENRTIAFYQIITPSAWNLSTQSNGMKGTGEQALIGAPVNQLEAPVEIGRIIRSFDPCVSCATHVFSGGKHRNTIQLV